MEAKSYIERGGKTLKIQVYYQKGGMNYFQGVVEKRGYCLSVSPVNRTKHESNGQVYYSESYTAFSGTKIFLLEVKRCSDKAMAEALKLAEAKQEDLINHVLNKN